MDLNFNLPNSTHMLANGNSNTKCHHHSTAKQKKAESAAKIAKKVFAGNLICGKPS